ncbi:MAG: putative copper-transporting ATPase PacS [Planctomycetes bacterium ADurb.Bin069]|nr:MAG: putative copper-transporting ATPase PacS [Planctomycetes bacterium ADurb.Bin069]
MSMGPPVPTSANAAPAAAATELLVTGMNCGNCARHVTDAIQKVPGVQSASVMLEAGRATVRWTAGAPADVAAVLAAVKQAGYEARTVAAAAREGGGSAPARWHLNLWLGVLVTGVLMAGEWILGLGAERWFQWLAFALAGVVQVLAGAKFYAGAWRQLKVGGSNMDTLVALGSTTAFGYSAWVLFSGAGGHVYFMEAAAIITVISVGHWLETRVAAHASGALKALLELAPETARRLERDHRGEREVEVPAGALRSGDLIALRPGDRLPTDGVAVEGHSAVNEAMLTGEAAPVDKAAGSKLYAGTVNLNGRLVVRVTATGEATALAHIIAAVQRAQTSRADIQRLADRVSNVFVPVVVAVAVGAGLWWGLAPESARATQAWLGQWLWPAQATAGVAAAFIVAAAVLIIACPCAMGLATPAAIMAGANAAAQRGILIRDGVALEKAGNVTAIVLDKTGTLTTGELAVTGPWTPEGSQPSLERARQLAGALAGPSAHPVSRVLARFSGGNIEVTDWREIPGSGVQARLGSDEVRLGSLPWLRAGGVNVPEEDETVAAWRLHGAMLVGLARGSALLGIFALRDFLKPGAVEVVRRLRAQGLKTFLLTGDNPRTARAVAGEVGIAPDNVFAEVRPEQKAEFVLRLQRQGERVAFVGDGINDAPALEQADLGFAVSRASDIAREAADIVLLKSEIEAVPEALGLARATLRTIKQNLFWAFFYNAVGVPLAALGFMSPILCAAAMGCSDLVVIGNALRLRWWRLRS